MESLPLTLPLPNISWEDQVAYMAWKLKCSPGHSEVPVVHIFEPGVYIREMRLPAEILFIGRPHTKGHFLELISGEAYLFGPCGAVKFEAPYALMTEPGAQAVARTITPCLVRTIHKNPGNSHNIAELELEAFLPAESVLARGEQIERKLRGLLT